MHQPKPRLATRRNLLADRDEHGHLALPAVTRLYGAKHSFPAFLFNLFSLVLTSRPRVRHGTAFGVNSLHLLRVVKQTTLLPTAGHVHFLLSEVLHDRECLEKGLPEEWKSMGHRNMVSQNAARGWASVGSTMPTPK